MSHHQQQTVNGPDWKSPVFINLEKELYDDGYVLAVKKENTRTYILTCVNGSVVTVITYEYPNWRMEIYAWESNGEYTMVDNYVNTVWDP